jgi:heat shock transcription factor 1
VSSSQASGAPFTNTGLFTAEPSLNNGPIISDVTDLAQASPVEVTNEWIEERLVSLPHFINHLLNVFVVFFVSKIYFSFLIT